jgi:uncharacterized protein HemX
MHLPRADFQGRGRWQVILSYLIHSGEESARPGLTAAAILFAAGGIAFGVWAVWQYRKERKHS